MKVNNCLKPFVDIQKDWNDTFIFYKSPYHLVRDVFQFIYGMQNLLKGIALVFIAPRSRIIEGIGLIIRGLIQIVLTPLTWFIKIPLRILYTIWAHPDALLIENNKGIQKLKQEYNAMPKNSNKSIFHTDKLLKITNINQKLNRKVKKSLRRGQKTNQKPDPDTGHYFAPTFFKSDCSHNSEKKDNTPFIACAR